MGVSAAPRRFAARYEGEMTDTPTPSQEGAVFDFDDLQALREEYEDQIKELEAARDAATKALADERATADAKLKHELDTKLAAESAARQDLIESLSYELAAAREEGMIEAKAAEARAALLEQKLTFALGEVGRIEGELARVKDALMDVLAPGAASAAPTTIPQPAVTNPSSIPQPAPQMVAPQGARLFQAMEQSPELEKDGATEPSDVASSQPGTAPAWHSGKNKRKIRLR